MIKKLWNYIKSTVEHFSKAISNIVNFILLLIVYIIGIGAVSIVMKLLGNHFLDIKKQNRKTNWHDHKLTKQRLEKYYRAF